MPIRPENKALYPTYWPQIREAIRARSGNYCEGSPDFPECTARNGGAHPVTGSKVVLTVAHLDHDPTNNDGMKPGDPAVPLKRSNLRHWCQRCHLNFDQAHHQETRYTTSRANKAVGDLFQEIFSS